MEEFCTQWEIEEINITSILNLKWKWSSNLYHVFDTNPKLWASHPFLWIKSSSEAKWNFKAVGQMYVLVKPFYFCLCSIEYNIDQLLILFVPFCYKTLPTCFLILITLAEPENVLYYSAYWLVLLSILFL